ncbi:hypothetical protein MATL_G00079910 [Megalops atlanticus]|uniref:Uncharacterized protein n=1 Tax=Megalops atlanticus TaxID=7932 RepID=A0A9D3Q5U2_MEGAT|nr:hypothetical protein MATL_G00079910 [Megalops atlanticus]
MNLKYEVNNTICFNLQYVFRLKGKVNGKQSLTSAIGFHLFWFGSLNQNIIYSQQYLTVRDCFPLHTVVKMRIGSPLQEQTFTCPLLQKIC